MFVNLKEPWYNILVERGKQTFNPVEDEMKYENRYWETKKTLMHFYSQCVYRSLRWIGILFIIIGCVQVITVLADINGLFQEPLNGKVRIFFFDLGLILAALGVLILCQPLITARIAYRQMKKRGNGYIPETVYGFGNNIHLSIGKSASIYSYDRVYRIIETKEEFALMIGKHVAIRVRKGCFSIGKESEFPTFLREKCPNVSWKRVGKW